MLSWWTPTRTTTNWPPIILGLPSLFLEMSVCRLMYHVHDFLSQQKNRLFLSELMDLFVAGRDQSAADEKNNLAEGHPPL